MSTESITESITESTATLKPINYDKCIYCKGSIQKGEIVYCGLCEYGFTYTRCLAQNHKFETQAYNMCLSCFHERNIDDKLVCIDCA